MKKAFGYSLLVFSFLSWPLIAALPLLDLSVGMATGMATALVIAGEVSFILAIALLGKEVWESIKSVFRKKKHHIP